MLHLNHLKFNLEAFVSSSSLHNCFIFCINFTSVEESDFDFQDEAKDEGKGKSLIAIEPPPKVQKVDLAALFTARQPSMPDTECVSLIGVSVL